VLGGVEQLAKTKPEGPKVGGDYRRMIDFALSPQIALQLRRLKRSAINQPTFGHLSTE
jgi:hypothetical protein